VHQPFEHVAEESLDEHLLLVVVEGGQLGSQRLAEEVCLHPGALHQHLLIVEHLHNTTTPSAASGMPAGKMSPGRRRLARVLFHTQVLNTLENTFSPLAEHTDKTHMKH